MHSVLERVLEFEPDFKSDHDHEHDDDVTSISFDMTSHWTSRNFNLGLTKLLQTKARTFFALKAYLNSRALKNVMCFKGIVLMDGFNDAWQKVRLEHGSIAGRNLETTGQKDWNCRRNSL